MKSSDKETSNFEPLFCDNHLLVAEKPAGLLTQPNPEGREASLEALAKAWVKERYQKPGNVYLHAVHRLDRPVSGLVLFARTSKALTRLNEEMRQGKIEKLYLAEVEGALEGEGRLKHFLVHGEHRSRISTPQDLQAKEARLTFRVVKKTQRGTLVEVKLETGRYHQIRAQLAAIGHPVVGDARYGAKPLKEGVIHLHSAGLSFLHPTTGERVTFQSIPQFSFR